MFPNSFVSFTYLHLNLDLGRKPLRGKRKLQFRENPIEIGTRIRKTSRSSKCKAASLFLSCSKSKPLPKAWFQLNQVPSAWVSVSCER